jgi:hypothetical protein
MLLSILDESIFLLKLDADIVTRNAGKNFYPAKEEMYSK